MRKIGIPERDDSAVEKNRDNSRHRYVDGGGQTNCSREEHVNRVLAVVERVAKSHRGDDAGQTECEGETVLHQHYDPRNDEGQHDQQVDDRLLITPLRAREYVDPRHWDGQQDGGDHCQRDRQGEIHLTDGEASVLPRPNRRCGRGTAQEVERLRKTPRSWELVPDEEADDEKDDVVNDDLCQGLGDGRAMWSWSFSRHGLPPENPLEYRATSSFPP